MKFFMIISLLLSQIFATGFNGIGVGASSLGGAGISNSDGRYNSYYNPALLNEYTKSKSVSWDFAFGSMLKFETDDKSIDLLSEIKSLASNNKDGGFNKASTSLTSNIQNSITFPNLQKLNNGETVKIGNKKEDTKSITSALNTLNNINDLKLDITIAVGLDLRVKNYALGFYESASLMIVPHISNNKTKIIQEVSNPLKQDVLESLYFEVDLDNDSIKKTDKNNYDNNSIFKGVDDLKNSEFEIKARALMEIPLSYSYRYNLNYNSAFDGYLNLGLSAKYMQLKEKSMKIKSNELSSISDKGKTYLKDLLNDKSHHNASFDFGILYSPNKVKNLKTALVIKNITSPSFGNSYTAKPIIRYGMSYTKWNIVTAFDLDITQNKTLSGKGTQIMGGGLGYKPFSWLGLSAGYKMDIAKKEELGEHRSFIALGMHLPLLNVSVQSVDFNTQELKSFQINFDLVI